MERRDWTLVALHLASAQGLSPVQLQKALFLLSEGRPASVAPGFYQFQPYNYGPFDATIYSDVEALRREGLAWVEYAPGQRWGKYHVTPVGAERADLVERNLDRAAVSYLEAVIKWAQGLSFQDLVRAIYAKFPQYRANSVFQD